LLSINLPFKTKLEEDCEMPQYGLAIHNETFWIYLGGVGNGGSKWITWSLPFFTYEFDGHKVQKKDGSWAEHLLDFKGTDGRYTETHPYTYTLKSGEVQNRTATVFRESRKWHRKWLPFLTITRACIDIEFNDEVGERTGSWKGGTTGCNYDALKGETMEQTLRRMEKDRKF